MTLRTRVAKSSRRIVYSDKKRLIGQKFDLSADARDVFESGGSEGGVPDLRRPENRYELDEGGLLEVYTRMESPEGEPLVLEIYWANDQLADGTEVVLDTFRPIAVGGVVLLGILTIPLLWGLHRRLDRAAEARERLLRTAVVASEEERRRIARDLHEGVVHSLDDTVALVWRVAREGVRNTVRHARARSLAVSVRRSRGRVELRVADDGAGFVPGAFGAGGRFGLRGLQDLAAEAGGRLQVTSGPGRGTVLLLDLPQT